MDRASAIREYYENQKEKRKVKTPDATHLATAIIYKANEFHTMDGLQKDGSKHRKLLALSGDKGVDYLKIVHPYPLNQPPEELIVVDGPLLKGIPNQPSNKQKVKAADEGGLSENGSPQGSKTMKKAKTTKPPSEEYANFERLAKQLLSVPKSEIDKREAEYQRTKKAGKKRKVA